jgi:hypothetical protein
MSTSDKPIYFLEQNNALIEEYKNIFDTLEFEETKKIAIDIDAETYRSKDVLNIQQLLLVLQHFPKCIPKFLFNIDFKFTEITGSQLYRHEKEWKTDPNCQRWFNYMLGFPVVPFFFHDEDARFFAFAGDMLTEKKIEVTKTLKNGKSLLVFSGENLALLKNRMFNSCWALLIYCHASGYDPQSDIEALLAFFDLDISYESIYEKYQKDVKEGIDFKVTGIS